MTKNDVINNICNKLKDTPQVISKTTCESVIDAFIDEVKNCLMTGDKLIIKGFMTYEVKERPEREGRNPNTGDVVTFPAVKTIKCNMCKAIKDAINGKGD